MLSINTSKNKHLKVLFGFWFWNHIKQKKQKQPWVFCFFDVLVDSIMQKKEQNSFFLCFGFWNQRKKLGKTQTIFWVKIKHPHFFWFSGSGCLDNPKSTKLMQSTYNIMCIYTLCIKIIVTPFEPSHVLLPK